MTAMDDATQDPATQELVLAEGDASRVTLPALMDLAVEAM